MSALIGALRATLGLDSAAFDKGATAVEKQAKGLERTLTKFGEGMENVGKKLSVAVTAPIIAAGVGVVRATANFEAGLGRIQIATEATAGEMKQMSELALKIGKDTTFGASEAASAMEMLAKAGIDTKTILGGAAEAVTALAAAAGSELDPAASAISDSINQFHLAAKDLPTIVNQITGAVNESKFDFADFTAGMAQGGGVAASAGLSFKDFAATLAATSSQFASGSDAGTSLKTFLLALTPATKKAAEAMAQYGLSFYDAGGKMKPIGDIAQMLRERFAGLDDATRNAALKDIFGTDAIRTAVGLMNQGADGLDRISAKLAATNAADQAAKRMQGFNGQLEQLKGSIETLAIRIGQSGILEVLTKMVTGLADLVDRMSQASPGMLRFATVAAAVLAALGPIALGIGVLVQAFAPLVAVLSTAAANGGVLVAARVALMALGASIGPLLPVLAAIAAAGYLIYQNWDKIAPALSEFWKQAQETLGPPLRELVSAITDALSELWNGPLGDGIRAAGKAFVEFQIAYGKALGPVALQAIKVLVEALSSFFRMIGDGIHLVSSLLNGDWKSAFTAATSLVDHLFMGLPGKVNAYVAQMVQAVRTWVIDKLSAIWDQAKAKIDEVKSWFYGLYDAVVGHSYIPDMVDGIAATMARLDSAMVKPAKEATDKTKAIFAKLAEEVQPLLDRLFPEAAALNKYRDELRQLDRAEKGKVLTPEQAAEARRRLFYEGHDSTIGDRAAEGVGPLGVMDPDQLQIALGKMSGALGEWSISASAAKVQVVQSFKDMAQGTLDAVNQMVGAIKGGGFLDILSSVIGLGLQLGSIGVFGKNVATRINAPTTSKIPSYAGGTGFHPGGLARVGEKGPELVDLPRGSKVYPNGTGPDGMRISVVPSPYFDVVVDGRINQASPTIAMAGAQGGAALAARRAGQQMNWTLR